MEGISDMYLSSIWAFARTGRYDEIPELARIFAPHVNGVFSDFKEAIKEVIYYLKLPQRQDNKKYYNPLAAEELQRRFLS